MQTQKKWIALAALALITLWSADAAWSGSRINIGVKTIHASQGARFVDPNLAPPLVKELQSMFRYSAYRMIGQNQMNLGMGQTGSAPLPGKRSLRVTPLGIKGNRAEMKLEISKQQRQIFQTTIQLRNRSSIIFGGPKHKGGVLLFKVSNSF